MNAINIQATCRLFFLFKSSLCSFFLFSALLFSSPLWAATFTVTNTGDAAGAICASSCSLRQAITAANATPELDTINFDIPASLDGADGLVDGVYTIKPASVLPIITQPVIIDGEMAAMGWTPRTAGATPGIANEVPAHLVIEISGSLAPLNTNGLVLSNTGSTVKGIVINDFRGLGVTLIGLNSAVIPADGHHTIQGNYIGTDPAGTLYKSNLSRVGIAVRSSDNIIGGINPAERNVISGIGGGVIGTSIVGGRAISGAVRNIAVANANTVNTKVLGNIIGASANVNLAPIGNAEIGAVFFGGSSDTQVEGNYFDKNGRGLDVFSAGATNYCILNPTAVLSNVVIKDNVFKRSSRTAISFTGNHCGNPPANFLPTVIEGNTIDNNPYGIVLEVFNVTPSFMKDLKVRRNILSNGEIGILLMFANTVDLSENQITGFNHYGLAIINGSNDILVDKNIISNSKNGIMLGSGRLAYREFGLTTGQPEIGPEKVLIKNNSIFNNTATGVLLGSQFTACASGCQVNDPTLLFPFPAYYGAMPRETNQITLSQNAIYSNGALGIDLTNQGGSEPPFLAPPPPPTVPNQGVLVFPVANGVTLNDSLGHVGANNFQNFPNLQAEKSFINPEKAKVQGSLDSNPNQDYLIEVFANLAGDPSNYGEGRVYIGKILVHTDNTGHADFTMMADEHAPVAKDSSGVCKAASILTATATDMLTGNTSEFSKWVAVDVKGSATAYSLRCDED